ncbi:hypothetical protein CYR40_21390 [Chimaeribacter arupi]|uniref:hypothetical protein n=1 Tax=Chimaeribacter arupi TaxID=2060066 RepID=UPI000C7E4A56|nr:hypothetical protein [Chimaeribacter arupi]PLR42151.1 hypothetical protein CYR40_21390 [Chimaeribacter arupi]
MSAQNKFFKKLDHNISKKAAADNLQDDIEAFRKETKHLLVTVEKWFADTPIHCKKWENSLTEHIAPEVIYHIPGMTLINEEKHLHITPLGMYCLGGVKGRLLVSLHMNGEEKKLFECRLNDSRADFDDWALIDCANKKKILPFREDTFFDYIFEFA